MLMLEQDKKKICYQTTGCKNHPCLILIMGIASQLISWPVAFIDGLAKAGFYVITFDNRDVGCSSYYDQLEAPSMDQVLAKLQQGQPVQPPYSLNDMASDVVTLMDGLAIEKAHIAGLSMGGQIAQVFALDHPERTLSLTLIASSSADPDLPPPTPEVLDFFSAENITSSDSEAAMERHIAQHKIYQHPDDFDEDEIRAVQKRAYKRAYHPAGNYRQLLATICAAPRGEALKTLKIPTLIVHGNYDPVFSIEHGKYLASVIKNSRLLSIPNMGHGLSKRVYASIIHALARYIELL